MTLRTQGRMKWFLPGNNRVTFIVLMIFCNIGLLVAQDEQNKITKLPVKFSGSAVASANFYNSNYSTQVASPFGYNISISPALQIGKLNLPFNFSYADTKYNLSYPYFRLGMAPSYKWVKLYAGNNTINFSKYVFAGLNTFGAGIELNPSIFSLGLFVGRLRQKIFLDSTQAKYSLVRPQFSSKGFAIRAGIRAKSIKLLVTYFSGKDNSNSISYINPHFLLHPRKNTAMGSEIYIRITKNISILSNAGLTIMTRSSNILDIDTTLANSGEKPLPSWVRILERSPNLSTYISYAYDNSLKFNSNSFDISFKQKVIKPGYETMGLAYINNDIKQFSVEPALRLLKKKLNLSFSLGLQSDNLNQHKSTHSNNTIFSGNINFNDLKKWIFSANYVNYGLNIQSNPELISDSISVRNINSSYSINTIYFIAKEKKESRSINLNISAQNSKEIYAYNSFNDKTFNSLYTNLSYVNNKQEKLSYILGLNYNKSTNIFIQFPEQLFQVSAYGLFVSFSKAFLKEQKWFNNFSLSINNSSVNQDKYHVVLGGGIGSSYKLSKKTTIALNYNFTSNRIKDKSIIQQYANLGLTQNF